MSIVRHFSYALLKIYRVGKTFCVTHIDNPLEELVATWVGGTK